MRTDTEKSDSRHIQSRGDEINVRENPEVVFGCRPRLNSGLAVPARNTLYPSSTIINENKSKTPHTPAGLMGDSAQNRLRTEALTHWN